MVMPNSSGHIHNGAAAVNYDGLNLSILKTIEQMYRSGQARVYFYIWE